jgi:phage/plasmid-like protein (TIGR03299 family)
MAHEIVNNQIAYTGEKPWHSLGVELPPESAPQEFLEAAGLNWKLEKRPLFYTNSEGKSTRAKGQNALIRETDDAFFGTCGDTWNPLQNADVVQFMDHYVRAGGAVMETFGALRDGKIVWALARLNHSFDVRGDQINGYLLITSPHVVGKAITVRTTTVRVVCNNTMQAAMGEGTMHYSQSHRGEFNVESAREAVAEAHESLAAAERRWKTLDQIKLNLEDAEKVLRPIFGEPTERTDLVKEILNAAQNAPGAVEGTAWGILNGVTFWADHINGRAAGSRMNTSWVGRVNRKKLATESALLELA